MVFGDLLLIISKNCKTAIFKSIPPERKGISYRKTITPFKETIDLMCNPPTFLGNTDEKLHMLRLLAGTLRLFILQKIAPSSDPIKIREAPVDNLVYRAHLISRDGTFNLDDFQKHMYPELLNVDNKYEDDVNVERSCKRHKNDIIIAITSEQISTILTTYVDPSVIANRPLRCSLEAKIRRGIDEEDFIKLSIEYMDKAISMMGAQMPLLVKQTEIEGMKQLEVTKRQEEEKLIKTKRQEEELLLVTKRLEEEKLEEKKREEFEKMKNMENKLELQKQITTTIELKKEEELTKRTKENTKQAMIHSKLENKRLSLQDRELVAKIKKQNDEQYRLNLEAQSQKASFTQNEKSMAVKKTYVETFCSTNSKYPGSMSGDCARCTGRTSHFGSAGIFKTQDDSYTLFCGKCVPFVKREKKYEGHFIKRPTFEEVHLSTWIQTNGPNFYGVCNACKHMLEYVNYVMAHNIPSIKKGPRELENLRASCMSCNLACGVGDFDDFKNEIYPDLEINVLPHKQAKDTAKIMISTKFTRSALCASDTSI